LEKGFLRRYELANPGADLASLATTIDGGGKIPPKQQAWLTEWRTISALKNKLREPSHLGDEGFLSEGGYGGVVGDLVGHLAGTSGKSASIHAAAPGPGAWDQGLGVDAGRGAGGGGRPAAGARAGGGAYLDLVSAVGPGGAMRVQGPVQQGFDGIYSGWESGDGESVAKELGIEITDGNMLEIERLMATNDPKLYRLKVALMRYVRARSEDIVSDVQSKHGVALDPGSLSQLAERQSPEAQEEAFRERAGRWIEDTDPEQWDFDPEPGAEVGGAPSAASGLANRVLGLADKVQEESRWWFNLGDAQQAAIDEARSGNYRSPGVSLWKRTLSNGALSEETDWSRRKPKSEAFRRALVRLEPEDLAQVEAALGVLHAKNRRLRGVASKEEQAVRDELVLEYERLMDSVISAGEGARGASAPPASYPGLTDG